MDPFIVDLGSMVKSQLEKINSNQIPALGNVLQAKLIEPESGFFKQYLRMFVSENQLHGNEIRMTGSEVAIMHAMLQKKMDTHKVPSFVQSWLPYLDSNQGPAD